MFVLSLIVILGRSGFVDYKCNCYLSLATVTSGDPIQFLVYNAKH